MLIYYICYRSEAAAEAEKEEAECKIIFIDFSDKLNAGKKIYYQNTCGLCNCSVLEKIRPTSIRSSESQLIDFHYGSASES